MSFSFTVAGQLLFYNQPNTQREGPTGLGRSQIPVVGCNLSDEHRAAPTRYPLCTSVNRRDGANSRRNSRRKNANAKRSMGSENPRKKSQSNVQALAVRK